METLIKDIRYGFRVMLKSPAFTLVAVISLALGIGANTAIFSIINSFLYSPLPVEKPDQLVAVFTSDVKNPGNLPTSHMNYLDYRDKNGVFDGMLAFTFSPLSFTSDAGSKQIFALVTSGNYFDVLGVKALHGRAFTPEEDKVEGAHPLVVLSYPFWQREFGGDPNVVGRTITLNRHPFTVVGIAPQDFTGTLVGFVPDLWVPMAMHNQVQPGFDWYNERRGLFLFMVGRLKDGVSVEAAQSAMTVIGSQLEQEYQKENTGRNVKLIPLLESRTNPDGEGTLSLISTVLMATSGIVLLIACANVANLLLARATSRRREIAIRLAIGASRARLIRQLLTESLLLSIVGGAVGFLVAIWARDILWSLTFGGDGGPNNAQLRLDSRVMIFAIIITIASGLIFGLAPALQASRPDLVPTLKGETLPPSHRRFRFSLRKVLVVAQVALSLVALIGAGLFVRSLQNASAINPGFITENIILADIDLSREGYDTERGKAFQRQLLERITSVAGVESATIASNRPFGGFFSRSVFIEGKEPPPGGRGVLTPTNIVGPRFFETMGIPILRGSNFKDSYPEGSPLQVIINEAMAARYWPDEEAIGKRFKFFGDENYREVIGIAKDSKYTSLTEQRQAFVYMPIDQQFSPGVTLYVRSSSDPKNLVAAIRNEVQQLDASLPLIDIETLEERMDNSLGQRRNNAMLLSIFGGLALMLAVVGLYGVMAYSVAQRTREIGIRMALGAQKGDVMRIVLKQALFLVAIGIGIGLAGALYASKFIAGLLFGVAAIDPLAFGAMSGVLALVAAVASYIPARRATKIDPLIALKYE